MDEDGDPVTLFAEFLPQNATFNSATGRFTFTPEARQLRRAQLGQGVIAIFVATDNRGAEATAIVDLTPVACVEGPMPPVLSVPPGPILVRVIDRLSFTVAGLAQSAGCSVSILSSSPNELAAFNVSNNTFSLTPNASMLNEPFLVTFTATDCAGRTRTAAVRIIIVDADSNCAPRGTGKEERVRLMCRIPGSILEAPG